MVKSEQRMYESPGGRGYMVSPRGAAHAGGHYLLASSDWPSRDPVSHLTTGLTFGGRIGERERKARWPLLYAHVNHFYQGKLDLTYNKRRILS